MEINSFNKTIVISAVNLIEGGGFSVLIDCLDLLSRSKIVSRYDVIALVNNAERMPKLDGISYLSIPKAKKSYLCRFYYEYIYFKRLSKKYNPTLWLSLHDMSPCVCAKIQAVYIHNTTPFYKPKWRDCFFTPITVAWSFFYKYIYRINIHANDFLIVQQQWLRDEFSKMFSIQKNRIIVARPLRPIESNSVIEKKIEKQNIFTFVYPAYPRVFKNFEIICDAARLLEKNTDVRFQIYITINGTENKYANYIVKKYSDIASVKFCGLIPKDAMPDLYATSDCLLFPSKLESWGLPLSEYKEYRKPIIAADLPYAHESLEGAERVCFIDPNNADSLAVEMEKIIKGDYDSLKMVPKVTIKEPYSDSWEGLFEILLDE